MSAMTEVVQGQWHPIAHRLYVLITCLEGKVDPNHQAGVIIG